MRILRDLQNVIASEYYKTRHDVAAKLFLFFPVLLTVAFIVYDLWNLSQEGYDGTNLWIYNIGRTLFMFYGMLYPLMAALFCAAYIGKEFKNDNYLLLFLFPVPRGTVYVAKLIYLISMTFLSVLIAYVAFMLSGFILGVCLPSMGFQNFDVRILVISVFFRVFIGLLPILVIQYVFSSLFKNYALALGFSFFMTVFSMIASNWRYINFIPYSSILHAYSSFMQQTVYYWKSFETINISYFIVFSIVGYILYRYKKWR